MLPVPGAVPFGAPAPSLHRPVLSGFAAAALFVAVLAGWSLFAEFSSAVAARGTTPVETHGKPAGEAVGPAAEAGLRERIARLRAEIAMERALLEASMAQQAFIDTERAHLERLYGTGYARLPRLLELQLAAADLEDREQRVRGNIARLGAEIAVATEALQPAPDALQQDAAAGAPQQTLALDAGFSD